MPDSTSIVMAGNGAQYGILELLKHMAFNVESDVCAPFCYVRKTV